VLGKETSAAAQGIQQGEQQTATRGEMEEGRWKRKHVSEYMWRGDIEILKPVPIGPSCH
jgi:hypothetical protein